MAQKPDDYFFVANLGEILSEIPQDGILSRTFFKGDDTKGILFAFDSGQELSEHTASSPAILHFLQGEADLTLGGESQQAQANTWVYMPPNLPHSIVAKTPLIMLLILLQG